MIEAGCFEELVAALAEDSVDTAFDDSEEIVDPLLSQHDVAAEVIDVRLSALTKELGDNTLPDLKVGTNPLDCWAEDKCVVRAIQFAQYVMQLDLEGGGKYTSHDEGLAEL